MQLLNASLAQQTFMWKNCMKNLYENFVFIMCYSSKHLFLLFFLKTNLLVRSTSLAIIADGISCCYTCILSGMFLINLNFILIIFIIILGFLHQLAFLERFISRMLTLKSSVLTYHPDTFFISYLRTKRQNLRSQREEK